MVLSLVTNTVSEKSRLAQTLRQRVCRQRTEYERSARRLSQRRGSVAPPPPYSPVAGVYERVLTLERVPTWSSDCESEYSCSSSDSGCSDEDTYTPLADCPPPAYACPECSAGYTAAQIGLECPHNCGM